MNETPAAAAAILSQGSERLDALFSELTAHAAEARGTIGGGTWSARDLAGHVATWEEVALRTSADVREGRPPGIRSIVTDEASLDRFNAAEVERKASIGWEEALTSFRTTNARLVATVEAISAPGGEGDRPRTLGEQVGSSTGAPQAPFRHAWAHLRDLEAFVHAATEGPDP